MSTRPRRLETLDNLLEEKAAQEAQTADGAMSLDLDAEEEEEEPLYEPPAPAPQEAEESTKASGGGSSSGFSVLREFSRKSLGQGFSGKENNYRVPTSRCVLRR